MRELKKEEKEIREFWDKRVKKHGEDWEATIPDKYLRELEIKNVLDFIFDGQRILSVGCGNGYTERIIAKNYDVEVVGIDYSKSMIEQAQERMHTSNLKFEMGNVLDLSSFYGDFDLVVSYRCLINLTSFADQKKAIKEINKCLYQKGQVVLSEDILDSLKNLNNLRRLVGLYEINPPWHNLYFRESNLIAALKEYFEVIEVRNFSSTYYLASRVFNAINAKEKGEEPDYYSPINKAAAKLPILGDYGPLKLFVCKKSSKY